MSDDHPLEDVLTKAAECADGDAVSLNDILQQYDDRSFGPIFCLLGLLVALPPLGGIPGLPTVVGCIILLFSLQMIVGRTHIWLPKFLRDLSISKGNIETAHDKSETVLKTIDSAITERLAWATGKTARFIAAILVSFLALSMIPLEVVPFAVAMPGAAIAMIGVSLIARDGAIMLMAFVLAAIATFLVLRYSPILSWIGV